MYFINVIQEACSGCSKCINICPKSVFEMGEGIADPSSPLKCVNCESCLAVCEEDAIKIENL